MFNQNASGYSLADIAAATGNNNNGSMWSNDGAWWIIILFLIWGGRGWGCGNGVFGGATGSGITDGYILTSDFANLERKVDTVNGGLCDGFYAMNTGMLNGFAAVNNNITQQTIAEMQNTNGLTAQINAVGNQIQQCCCDNERLLESNFSTLNYNLADLACRSRQAVLDAKNDIIQSNEAGVREILKYLLDDKVATLQAENQALKSAASQAEQNAYLIHALNPSPVPAYTVPNPYTGYGYTGTCGCGCGV